MQSSSGQLAPAGATQRTVVASAPADDTITQLQIALNNLIAQVREAFFSLLEIAPPLDAVGRAVKQNTSDTLARWKKFRVEFEAKWRAVPPARGGAGTQESGGVDAGGGGDGSETGDGGIQLADEMDVMAAGLPNMPTEGSAEQFDICAKEALFRAQRLAVIVQHICALSAKLPSTGQCLDPHTDPRTRERLKELNVENAALDASLKVHFEALRNCLGILDDTTSALAEQIIIARQDVKPDVTIGPAGIANRLFSQ